ncbi:conjugative transfer relaxase/helicase TraI, partial [Salmonella enterica subsp. enterica serovar Richmond]|nr:conjugative transfer relaxase/helicase TraI [Salmonella enterica subsp. enterica serovar Richmond]
VRFTRNDREQGRDTQTLWTVSQISADGTLALTNGNDTRHIQPGTELQDSHLDYAYAGTAHRAQGASESFVIALAGATGSRKMLAGLSDAYVALSRMKEHVQVYTDDLSKWMSAVADSTTRLTAHDVLGKEQDRRASAGQSLWESAGPLNATAIGRALLRETGLSPEGEARFVSGSRKYPSPHVAWPAYDRSGHQQGVWLSEIRQDGDGRLQGISENGRLLGAESAELIVLQQSRSGITHQVSGQQEALKLAAAYPESGVVLTAEKEHMPDWLLQKLTQGQRPDNVEAVPLSQTQDSTVVVLQTPEEKARQAA